MLIILVVLSVIVFTSACSNSAEDIGYWEFDEGTGGVATDSSPNSNDGEIHNATWVSGVSGSALHFDGTDYSYVEVPDRAELTPAKRLTIEAWIKPESYPQEYIAILYKADSQLREHFAERSYTLWANSDGGIHFTWTPEGGESQEAFETDDGLIPTGAWSHIKVELNTEEGKVRIFISDEKVLEDNCTKGSIQVGDSPLRIGGMFRSEVNQAGFAGSIDGVRIY